MNFFYLTETITLRTKKIAKKHDFLLTVFFKVSGQTKLEIFNMGKLGGPNMVAANSPLPYQ